MTREEFDTMLNAPLPGRSTKPTPAQLEAEGQAFLDFMGQIKGG